MIKFAVVISVHTNWIRVMRIWRERREVRERLQVLRVYGWIERLFECGLLSFDYGAHRLFIAQPLALVLMQKGAEGWVRSVHHIYNYTTMRAYQQGCAEAMQREELAAVRRASEELKVKSEKLRVKGELTRDDVERIRRSRRMELTQGDMPEVKVEPFEFFIIPDSTAPQVEPLAVGWFNPETGEMDVAAWEDVKHLIKKED